MCTFLNDFPVPPVVSPDHLAQHQAERKDLQHLLAQHQAELQAVLSQEFHVVSHNQLQLRDKTLLRDYNAIRELRRALSLPDPSVSTEGDLKRLANQAIDQKTRTRAWSRMNDLYHQKRIKELEGKRLNHEACQEFASLKSQYPNWTPPPSEKSSAGVHEQSLTVPESKQAQANVTLPDTSSLRDREDVPLLNPGDELRGIVSYFVVKKVDHGGQGHIYQAYYQGDVKGEIKYYVAIKQQRRRRSDIASEAEVYFKLDPAESTHLSLLSDAVNHPLRSEVPLLITEWAEQGSLKSWLKTKRGCAVSDCPRLSDKKRCSRCQVVHYCTREHQEQHWKSHKHACKSAQMHGMQLGLAILIQVASGVASLHTHKAKLVHQDLKPANVLLYEHAPGFKLAVPLVKVADFGLCSTHEDEMGTDGKGLLAGRTGGTREYMAPDQARQYAQRLEGKIAVGSENAASKQFWDLWAFGLLVVEVTTILTGRRGLLIKMEGYRKKTNSDLFNAFERANASVESAVESMKTRALQLARAMSVDTKHPLASTWTVLARIVSDCFSDNRLTSSDCVRMLTDAYNQLGSGSRFPSVIRPSSTQYRNAVDVYKAYSPREHQARFESRVLNEYTHARDLLRQQVCEDLKQESTTPIERLLTVADRKLQSLREKTTRATWLASLLDMVCAYGGEWPMQTSESEPAGLGKVVIQLHMLWERSNDKRLCSRRLGTSRDVFGPLHFLCRRGVSGAIQQALLSIVQVQGRAGAARLVNCTEPGRGFTSLYIASQIGHGIVVDRLLASKANINHAATNGNTSLLSASYYGHGIVVDRLLESKANVNHANAFGATPLILASLWNRPDVCVRLIAAGADIHARALGKTAADVARLQGHSECVRVIEQAMKRN
jgi:serine/threonine protein kinase